VRDGGRIAAAIEVLDDMEAGHRPARIALKRWSDGARYAGAKDRAFVSGLVLDALRKRRSMAWRMGMQTNRARVLGVLRFGWDWPSDRLEAAFGEDHGPGALTADELDADIALDDAPADVRGDYPEWLDPLLARVYGDNRAEEGAFLAARAPVDLRVNTLKSTREAVLQALEPIGAQPVEITPLAVRVPAPDPAIRAPAAETFPAFPQGWFEVQDVGSQLAAACAGDVRGLRVLDLCAGGGGKTLALGAAMDNTGALFAYDADARRMKDLIPRAQRAGLTNLEVRVPMEREPFRGLEGGLDLVFVDAPCSGSGTWRRHPDAKWRLSPQQLERRMAEQDGVLDQAARLVRRGGRIIYVTCSLLAEENEDRVAAFLTRSPGFSVQPAPFADLATPDGYLRLSPRRAGTDGFFAAVLERSDNSR
jgi:16S rRNA (cytosine967-C5)-methyltransferase